MPFVDAAKNAMLDAIDEAAAGIGAKYVSLHSAYSASGASELTGGSPAYARKAATWNAAASGSKALSGNLAFDVAAGATVAFVGLWDAVSAGNFLGMWANGGGAVKPFALDDTTADTFKCAAHGLANDDRVVFYGSALPAGVTQGTVYWVINSATNTFQVSSTQGGAAVAITAAGNGSLQKVVIETFGAQGTFTVQASGTAMDLNAL